MLDDDAPSGDPRAVRGEVSEDFYLARVHRLAAGIAAARSAGDGPALDAAVRAAAGAMRACRWLGIGARAGSILAASRDSHAADRT